MKRLLFNLFLFLSFIAFNQTNAELLSVQIEATVQESPAQITLNWTSYGSPTGFDLYRRTEGQNWTSIASLPGSMNNYTDLTVSVDTAYEYKIVKNGSTDGYGYIDAAITLPAVTNRGIMIVVVEDTYQGNPAFDNAINQTIKDIENDGWFVKRVDVNQSDAVSGVKTAIETVYNEAPNMTKALYLIGHVPVAYTGNFNPDGHSNHIGAWASDTYYADMDHNWTDANVNNTSAAQSRNHNVPGDGKFDQDQHNGLELQVGRVDFANMGAFSASEEELLIRYLNKAHAYKTKVFTAQERAIVDDNFTSYAEGFASSGYRNFAPLVATTNIDNTSDYMSTQSAGSYMWSYGCGAGSFTSCSGIGNTSNFASDSLQNIFTMLFGSYFGDWDSDNNLLRASIAQGQTLNATWAGRPHWYFHKMALGGTIGASAQLSQNNTSDYFLSTLLTFIRWNHMGLMGDPSTRMHYITPPSNLSVTNVNNAAEISWTASTDNNVLGYNIYRFKANEYTYTKVNTPLVTGTTYTDNTVPSAGEYTYVIKAVKLKNTPSGTYYNQSLGIRDSDEFSVGVEENVSTTFKMYPNPAHENVQIIYDADQFSQGLNIVLYNLTGQRIKTEIQSNANGRIQLSTQSLKNGVYLVNLTGENGFQHTSKLVVRH